MPFENERSNVMLTIFNSLLFQPSKKVKMKYLSIFLIAFIGLAAPAFSQADAIARYFDQYVEDERFTVVYLSPKVFEILGKLDLDDLEDDEAAEVMSVVEDLRSLRILTTESNPLDFYEEAKRKINTKEYEVLMTVRNEDQNVNFMVKDQGDVIEELLLLVGGVDSFVLMSFIGNIDLNKISKLAKSVDIDGMEHLENLEDRQEN